MADLDQLYAQPTTPRTVQAQCYEAKVVRVNGKGVYVTVPGFDRDLFWGPCLPQDATAQVGDQVTILMSNAGRPWLLAPAPPPEPPEPEPPAPRLMPVGTGLPYTARPWDYVIASSTGTLTVPGMSAGDQLAIWASAAGNVTVSTAAGWSIWWTGSWQSSFSLPALRASQWICDGVSRFYPVSA